MPTITRSEGVHVRVLALIVVAVTSVPYALGFARSDVNMSTTVRRSTWWITTAIVSSWQALCFTP